MLPRVLEVVVSVAASRMSALVDRSPVRVSYAATGRRYRENGVEHRTRCSGRAGDRVAREREVPSDTRRAGEEAAPGTASTRMDSNCSWSKGGATLTLTETEFACDGNGCLTEKSKERRCLSTTVGAGATQNQSLAFAIVKCKPQYYRVGGESCLVEATAGRMNLER